MFVNLVFRKLFYNSCSNRWKLFEISAVAIDITALQQCKKNGLKLVKKSKFGQELSILDPSNPAFSDPNKSISIFRANGRVASKPVASNKLYSATNLSLYLKKTLIFDLSNI